MAYMSYFFFDDSGGPLNKGIGDRLSEQGVQLYTVYGLYVLPIFY
jgi:hypothetical protein